MAKNKSAGVGRYICLLLLTMIVCVLIFIGSTHILYLQSYPKNYSEIVSEYALQDGLDENLVYSVIRSESRFNANAVSRIGACGLMQITEETFHWAKSKMPQDDATYQDIFDPRVNIRYGCCILKLLLNEFSDERTALAAYHAGWGNVKKWLSDSQHSDDGLEIDHIPFEDTNAYVNQVMNTWKIYQTLYESS